jgi:2-oxoglutarate dehydrogenase E2 component (dihydrolipoamide succinyltransferase)
MTIEIKVADFPESVTDGTVVTWHKQPGEAFARGENLVDIETDKVVFETPAPEDGVLSEILCGAGEVVVSGQVIGKMNAATAPVAVKNTETGSSVAVTASAAAADVPIAPAAKKLMVEHDLLGSPIEGSGKGGRVLKEDVLRYLQQSPPAVDAPTQTEPTSSPTPPPPVRTTTADGRPQKRVAMTRLRARVAERLVEAQQTAAILSTFNEVNMQPVMDMRARYRDEFEQQYGVRLGFMSFFVKAVVDALKHFPVVNASIEGNDVVYHGFFDIGIAVGSPRGLVVPILRDADTLSMAEIESSIKTFGDKAQDGSLSIEEITGGTFTITNGGVFGSLLSTPILNPPQSAILGMHKIEKRPVVENDQVVIRPMMYLALSYDHRLIDGREAVQFLVAVKEALEDPARLMLGI